MDSKTTSSSPIATEVFTSKFPIYSMTYHQGSSLLILGGGGGPSRSGIPNGIVLLRIQDAAKTKSKFAFQEAGELRTGDEAVMSLSLYDDLTDCLVVAGVNDRCWLLECENSTSSTAKNSRVSSIVQALNKGQSPPQGITSTPLNLLRTIQSDSSPNDDGYLRVTRFSSTGRSFLAAGSDGCVREWTVPEMRLVSKLENDGEILDTDIFEDFTALVSEKGSIHLHTKNKKEPLILSPSASSAAYKFVRFLKTKTETLLIAVENVKITPKSSSKKCPRVVIFDLNRIKDGNNKPLSGQTLPVTKNCTCFTVSSDFISFGFADGSLLVLSTLNPSSVFLLKKTIHPFPVTGLAVDTSKRILLSSSADGTVLIHQIPSKPVRNLSSSSFAWFFFLTFLISLVVLFIAILSGKVNEIDDFDSFYKFLPTNQEQGQQQEPLEL